MKQFKISTFQKMKIEFNPGNPEHLQDYYEFRKNRRWRNGCSYILEFPYLDMPSMINSKIVDHFLKEFANEQTEDLTTAA